MTNFNNKIEDDDTLHNEFEEEPTTLTLEKEAFENIIKDMDTKHTAEKDALNSEILILKKLLKSVVHKQKILSVTTILVLTYLQDELIKRDRELCEVDKLLIMNEKLKMENEELKYENKAMTDRVTTMTRVMLEYDKEAIEQSTADDVNCYFNKLVPSRATLDGKYSS